MSNIMFQGRILSNASAEPYEPLYQTKIASKTKLLVCCLESESSTNNLTHKIMYTKSFTAKPIKKSLLTIYCKHHKIQYQTVPF